VNFDKEPGILYLEPEVCMKTKKIPVFDTSGSKYNFTVFKLNLRLFKNFQEPEI
jgi:hypothetical protein